MGSKQSVGEQLQHCTVLQSHPVENPHAMKYFLLGAQETGKTTLLTSLLSAVGSDQMKHRYKSLNSTCISVLLRVRTQDFINKQRGFENFSSRVNELYITNKDPTNHTGIDLFLKLWNSKTCREYLLDLLISGAIHVPDNIETIFYLIQHNKNDVYYKYSPKPTMGYYSVKHENIEIFDFGGSPAERRKWCTVSNASVLCYTIPLSDFNEKYWDKEVTDRLTTCIEVLSQVLSNDLYSNSRIVLLFTKPDVLVYKLKLGMKYTRKLDFNIRNEFRDISQRHGLKVIVNSIVSEVFKSIDTSRIESYHVVNATAESEVDSIFKLVKQFPQMKGQQKSTPFISPCIIASHNYMSKKLLELRLRKTLIDITIVNT